MLLRLNKKTLGAAALCAGGAAVLLHPVSLVTLGLGIWLGHKGKGQALCRSLMKTVEQVFEAETNF